MLDKNKINTLEVMQPVSADRFLSSQNQKLSEFELINLQFQSNVIEEQVQSISNFIDEYLEKIDTRMKEINSEITSFNNYLVNELRLLYIENKNEKKKLEGVYKIISLFLSFYGYWREAEQIMKSIQTEITMKSTKTSSKRKEINDIYDFILELVESEYEMNCMMKSLLPDDSGIQVEKDQKESVSTICIQFKETLFFTLIQTFNVRMNVISEDIYKWLITNEKLSIIEIILDNGRFCASQKQSHYQQTKKQEKRMLKWLHQYLIVKKKYNNEIELLLNMNENNLELLSSKYMHYIVRQERIPTNYIVNRSLIKEAVCQQNVPLISIMLKLDRIITQQTLHSKRVQAQVKIFLQNADTFSIGLYFIKKMSQKHQIKTQTSEYLEQILRLLERPRNDEKFALELYNHCLHPLVLCLVASKILLKLSFSKNPFSSEMLKLAKSYLDKAMLYRDTIFDAREMSLILFKPLFPSDKPLVKALRNEKYCKFFTEFFVHPCITYLLEQKWMSTYGFDRSLLVSFTPASHYYKHAKLKNTVAKSSKSNSFSSFQKSIKSTGSGSSFSLDSQKQNWIIFKDIEISQLPKVLKNNHFYQFVIYNKSVAVRTFFEFIMFLIIFGLTLYYLYQFIQNYNDFTVIDEQFKIIIFEQILPETWLEKIKAYLATNPTPAPFPYEIDPNKKYDIFNTEVHKLCTIYLYQMSSGYQPFIDNYFGDCLEIMRTGLLFESQISDTITVLWFIFCIGANAIQKQIYVYLIRRKKDPSILDLYDLLLYIACAAFLLTKQVFIPDGIAGGYTYYHFDFYTYILKIISCVIVFLLWLRMFLFFIRSQKIGLLVKIIILFVKDLMQFIIILFTVVGAFAAVNYILFQNDLTIYKTIDKAIFNLIAAGFGAFDFNNQNAVQSIIMIVFLIAVNVILMNLLIAILNTRYEKTMKQSEMEYSLVVYNDYINQRFHPIYMCMISLPPPFNILNFIFGVIAFITKSREWNKIALKIGYTIVIMLPCSLLYIALSVAFIPISYVIFIHQVSLYAYSDNMMCARKRSKFYKCSIYIFRVLTWIALGIPYLLIVFLIHDLPLFYKSAFMHNNNKYNFTKNVVLDLRVVRYASLSSNCLHTSKKQVFNYLEFRTSLENKKEERHKKSYFYRFAQPSIQTKAKALQSIRQGNQTTIKNKVEPESIMEKNFTAAIKKFGDSKVKSDTDNVQLNNLLRSIKYSAIFFKKSKSTSLNLSKLLYIVKKKDQFSSLLQLNSQNFFLNRSFSSYANLSANNLI